MSRHNTVDFAYQKYVTINRQNNNYENNRKISSYFHSNSWQGKRAFIIGGGESVSSFDFGKLRGHKVITTNLGFLHYPDSDINYSMDSVLYDRITRIGEFKDSDELNTRHQKQVDILWQNYKGVRCFITPIETKRFGEETCVVKRIREITISKEVENGIYGGKCSGTGALMLAIALGVADVVLIGFDMKCKTKSHFHNGYDDRDLNKFNNKLQQYKEELEYLSPMIGQSGVQVYNASQDSELKCFPFTRTYL